MISRLLALFVCVSALVWPPAMAETLNLAGHWTIEVVDAEADETFSGTVVITATDDSAVFDAVLITEDSCCNGNYSKVQQKSEIIVFEREIEVTSQIETFIIQNDPNPGGPYTEDDFNLKAQDDGALLGLMNGWKRVRWVRANDGMV